MLQAEELQIEISGMKIAALAWGPKDGKPILALHGWLDNAASFIPLAPYLSAFRVIAIDLPGHGLSSHIQRGIYFHFIDLIPYTLEVTRQLGWKKFGLLGHSLGAGVATLIAGACPEHVTALALIDGLGPITIDEQQLPDLMHKSIDDYARLPDKKMTYYPSKEHAIEARLAVSKMERKSVELLVERGLEHKKNGFVWRTDPRLLCKTLAMFSETQVISFLKRITSKTCLFRPSPGWPFDEKLFTERIGYMQDIEVHRIEGNHHIHMDNPAIVGPILSEFFTRTL